MKRSGFALRKPPTEARMSVPVERKPKKCAICKDKFTPTRAMQPVCREFECAIKYADKVLAKSKARLAQADRKETKAKLEAIKRISDLEEECRRIVQKIARIRDRNDGCISCELPASWDGQWHGSHFRSHGACSALQFHLWNIHKACWICNKLYSGRINQYEPALVAKIGQSRVDWLKAQNQVTKPDRDYLNRFKRVMGKRLRRLEKRTSTAA